ncbi:hypothetical protein TIFTF001_037944 [Ficus carica]|uniref:Uncharacterized protein n=1 Tax=Ficus carica TaxID=3494 RepID=A0AA88E762_FICCA|nr:hypothetical protein TIFTF001_037944 [Ficus carica]
MSHIQSNHNFNPKLSPPPQPPSPSPYHWRSCCEASDKCTACLEIIIEFVGIGSPGRSPTSPRTLGRREIEDLGCKGYCEPQWPWRSRTSVTGEIGFVVWSTPSRREKDCNSGEENVEGNWESRNKNRKRRFCKDG